MTDERKISKVTALDELSGLFEQVATDPGGEWLNGGHASTLGWAAGTLTDFEARVRAEVAEEIANAIDMNVRNPDFSKQDRGSFVGFVPAMAYVAGHDKAAEIARSFADAPAAVTTAAIVAVAPVVQRAFGGIADAIDLVAGSSPDTTPEPRDA